MRDRAECTNLFFPTPARVACVYLAFSALWITGTDTLAQKLFPPNMMDTVQSVKGLFFITLSSGLIFVLLTIAHRAYARTKASAEAATAEVKTIDADLKSALEIRCAIFEMLPAIIVILDGDGRITDVNRSWRTYCIDHGTAERNFGVGLPYLRVASPVALAGEADRRLIEEAFGSILRQASESFSLEFPLTTEKGRTRWFEVKIQGIAAGAKRGVVVAHVDITDRKTREASLVLSDARFNALAWNAPYGIVIARNETILFANRKARQLFAVAPDGPVSDGLSAYLVSSAHSPIAQLMRPSGERGSRVRLEDREIPWTDGTARLLFIAETLSAGGHDAAAPRAHDVAPAGGVL